MKATLATVSFLVLTSSSVAMAATPVAGPSAHFRVDRVTGALVKADGAELAVSPTGTIGGLRTILREPSGKVWPANPKNGTILTMVGEFLDESDAGTPVVRDASGRVVLARGMSAAGDRVLTVESSLSWDGGAVWTIDYAPPALPAGEGAELAKFGTRTVVSLRIADQRTFQHVLPRGGVGDVAALSFDDLLLALNTGGLLRYQAGKLLWQLDAMPGGHWHISDIDLKRSIALITDQDGGVAGVNINQGTLLWRWHGPSSAKTIRSFLGKTRSRETQAATTALALADATSSATDGTLDSRYIEDEALRTECGVNDARFTPEGKVLISGNPLSPWVGLFDPAAQAFEGRELIDALALSGYATAADAYRVHGVALARDFFVIPSGPDGLPTPSLLFSAPEGWYTTPLADLQ